MNRNEDIERGLELIPRLGEVMPNEAGEDLTEIYKDIRGRLRVPFVNFLFRALANYPNYLKLAWGRISPHLLSEDFELSADDLRTRALIEPVPEGPNLDWMKPEDLGSVRDFTDTIHYVLPKLLLAVTAFDEGLGGASDSAASVRQSIEPGVAEGTFVLPMVSFEEADSELAALFGHIQERHGHPDVASYYRGLGNWPGLLRGLWTELEPMIGTEPYEERKLELLERSREAATRLPLVRVEEITTLGLNEEDVRDLRSMLAMFKFRIIPDTFLEVSITKAMLDGREPALSSRFSFA